MNDQAQHKTIDLNRGLYLIRYEGAEDKSAPPTVRVFPERGEGQNCTIIAPPDATDTILYGPPSGLVISAQRSCRLVIEVAPTYRGGSTAANVKIEPLTQGQLPTRASTFPREAPQPSAGELRDFRLMAHVAGIGDVTEPVDTWIAGPNAPARIEGICLYWPGKPQDLTIQYAVRFARPQRGDNQFVPLGTFAGTRGRALPLTGINLEVSGPGAHLYSVTAEAIFLGAPALRMSGHRINLSGPSGREPLVGIKLGVEHAAVQSAPQPTRSVAAPAQPPRSGGRVRVFRSRQGGAKPAV
ncbi:hypothetical protein [Bradyrhizobium guangzhouense]|uniref:hypothetical protein n=1 Tax=Bradyrhizobium guangzhouense TaxID=1325095 RepID=UPI001009DD9B|nr:hypothetical protein [Bradyrhizobium guangzhouense]RXH10109.1 hypothetical protein EAS54_32170 [Bradyrhizobium guangzhouense]